MLRGNHFLRLLDLLCAMLFAVAALIQLNDPDPAYWVVVYAATAALSLAAALNRFSDFWTLITIGGVLAGIIIALPGFLDYLLAQDPRSITASMSAEQPWVEPAREFLGLALALAALLWQLRRHPRSPQKS